MVWTKWDTDKMGLDKMGWTKWYRQNGMAKILWIKSSINPAFIDTMIFFINPASNLTSLAFPYVLIIYLLLLATKCILNSTELKCTQNIKLYHFIRTILSIPFCPMPFCPYTILSIPFCPYHFVRYHFVRSPSGLLYVSVWNRHLCIFGRCQLKPASRANIQGVKKNRHLCISHRHRYMCQFGIVTYASSVGDNLSLPAVQIYRVSRRTVTCALVIGIAICVSLESSPMHLRSVST